MNDLEIKKEKRSLTMRDQELSGTTNFRSKIGVADTGTDKEKEMIKDYNVKKKASFDSNDWINFPIV